MSGGGTGEGERWVRKGDDGDVEKKRMAICCVSSSGESL